MQRCGQIPNLRESLMILSHQTLPLYQPSSYSINLTDIIVEKPINHSKKYAAGSKNKTSYDIAGLQSYDITCLQLSALRQ